MKEEKKEGDSKVDTFFYYMFMAIVVVDEWH